MEICFKSGAFYTPYFEKTMPAGIIEPGDIQLPGIMITEAPIEQLVETTAPKWFLPVSISLSFIL